MEKTLEHLIELFTAPDVPAWGKCEEALDPPFWQTSDEATPADFPGEGLARYPMLYIGEGDNRMYLINKGEIVWSYCTGKGWEYDDLWMLSNGNILFSRMGWAAEVTPKKEIVWRLDADEGDELHALQPIGLDKVLLIVNSAKPHVKIINKRTGEVEYFHEVPYEDINHPHAQFRRIRYTAQDTFLIPYLSRDRVVEYDRDFNVVWSYEIRSPWAAIRLQNGNTLITNEKDKCTCEVNPAGEIVWQISLDELPEKYRPDDSQSCVRLKNGNTILCSRGGHGKTTQLVEVTPEKEVVWAIKDWKNLGPATAVQILSDPGISEIPGDCER